jgi:hypothetical protein
VKNLGTIGVNALPAAPDAVTPASASGGIAGRVVPAVALRKIVAVEPARLEVHVGRINSTTGAFEFRSLPPGRYDLLIEAVGRVYEGLRLKGRASRQKIQQVRGEIVATSFETEGSFPADQIVRLAAAGSGAQMLTVRARAAAKPASGDPKGRTGVWRIDLFDLVKERGTWRIARGRLLLEQEQGEGQGGRMPAGSAGDAARLTHSPALGGIRVGTGTRQVGTIDLRKLAGAESPGPSPGRPEDD